MPYYNDDGTEFDPDLIPRPPICSICARADLPDEIELVLCNLTRADQQHEPQFICYAFEPRGLLNIDLPGYRG
jgi:hypothetical protein